MRSYLSSHLLFGAQMYAARAQQTEDEYTGEAFFSVEHRAVVLSAVMSAAGFLESMVNELFQDAADGHGITGKGYLAPLTPRTLELMQAFWSASGQGWERPLEKYQLLLAFGEAEQLDRGTLPFQAAALLIRLRNVIVHYKPETVWGDEVHNLEQSLRDKFAENVMLRGTNPWWPDRALGAGAAWWSYRSAKNLADETARRLGVTPNYQRQAWTWP
jgi:hypothetical protein